MQLLGQPDPLTQYESSPCAREHNNLPSIRAQSKESFRNKQGYGTELHHLDFSFKINSRDVRRRILKTQCVTGRTC